MGINNKHIYSLAMAIALATVAVAGDLLAIRTTFDPTQGSFRLIYAFEAVIMGGMGSMWGTLLGGIVLGMSQTIGTQAFGAGWGSWWATWSSSRSSPSARAASSRRR